jgi:endo-1,3-1,4-beta-glycanase ExoK
LPRDTLPRVQAFNRIRRLVIALSAAGVASAATACDAGSVSSPQVGGATASSAGAQNETGGAAASVGGAANSAGGAPTALGGAPAQSGAGAGATLAGSGGAAAGAGGVVGSAGSAGSSGGGTFVLDWQDDFNSIDPSLWALETFTYGGNLAQFTPANASAQNGILTISLTPEPSDTAEPYRGVELRSLKTITYGKVEARIRFAAGSGVVSGLVLIYTPYPADDWNEIDIEHLGNNSNSAQLNCQVYTGPPVQPPVTQSVTPTQDPLLVNFGLDTETDFHLYAMEWTPTDVRFMVDGNLVRTWNTQIARMKLAQNVLFTSWASSTASWAGPLLANSAPTSADIDWIKVYDWQG